MSAVNVTNFDVMQWMEAWAPPSLAEDWDSVGLQIGDPRAPVNGIVTALTVTEDVVRQAKASGASLVVAHHPLFFGRIRDLRFDERIGAIAKAMIEAEVALFVAHTNLDAALGGVNDRLAEMLGLSDVRPLVSKDVEAPWYKLVVFVPEDSLESVHRALTGAGAGVIGDYESCTFRVKGEGTFLASPDASPAVGQVGRLERVEEVRLETLVRGDARIKAVEALLAAHPYEEPAYDLYPLARSGQVPTGLGRVGRLEKSLAIEEFLAKVKKSLSLDALRAAGGRPRTIERVAVLGGSGGKFVHQAQALGADALVTGDVSYHDADEARALGLLVVDGGHFGTEKHVPHDLARRLRQAADRAGVELPVEIAVESDAFWMNV